MIDALKEKSKKLGLAAVGIAPAISEVREAFDWAQSVVCAAISYLPPERDYNDNLPRGLVARVARGVDYHAILRQKLTSLAEVILRDYPGARVEICVDTSPLPERKLAVLSGIAWRGKNGNVFTESCGSWIALGEIVTDIKLETASSIITDKCGDCTRCIDSCPARAIVAPYEIDCSKCLSALTQSSGSIRADLRPAMGNRIYGCDVCQQVCPQNKGILPTTPEFAESIFPGSHPKLISLITMSAVEFRENVAPSSIGWIRRTRIRRNSAIAAGNLKCKDALPALAEMLRDENPILRETAAWAIKEINKSLSNEA